MHTVLFLIIPSAGKMSALLASCYVAPLLPVSAQQIEAAYCLSGRKRRSHSCACHSSSSRTCSRKSLIEESLSLPWLSETKAELAIPVNALAPLAIALFPLLGDTQDALAIEGQFALLEGRAASLIHPIVMGGLLIFTLRAGFLGWQWRRVRTIQDEINLLKKEVKPAEEGAPPSPLELKIKELTETRKELIKGGYRDRHYNAGSILLALGVFEAVGGCLNTWFRTGKLFPGPHLFTGAGITVLWALAAALVPAMQKGNETARSLHIGLNALNVILFMSQVPTGLEILYKVLEFTSWP